MLYFTIIVFRLENLISGLVRKRYQPQGSLPQPR